MNLRIAVRAVVAFSFAGIAFAQSSPPNGRYTHESFTIPASPRALAVGDFDHDGRPDVVASGFEQDVITLARNVGFGRFAATGSWPVGDKPLSVCVGDFDGDGNLDVANALWNLSSGYALFGDGQGGFVSTIAVHTKSNVTQIATADVDGDGDSEVIVTNGPNGLGAAHWNGIAFAPIAFTPHPQPSNLDVADVNGDGLVDVVTQDTSAKAIRISLGNGLGGFLPSTTIPTGTSPGMVLARDVQGDGLVDLLCQLPQPNFAPDLLACHLGLGGGAFASPLVSTVDSTWIDAGDVDLDGDLDLLGGPGPTTSDLVISEATLPGVFASPVPFDAVTNTWAGLLADVDGDGRPEALAVGIDTKAIIVVKGAGQIAYGTTKVLYTDTQTSTPTEARFVDANGDGDLDVVSYSPLVQAVQTRLGDGNGAFGGPTTTSIPLGGYTYRLMRDGDVDADGWPDVTLVYAGPSSGVITLRGNGTPQFAVAPKSNFVGPSGSYSIGDIALADFDDDADLDVVLAAGAPEIGVMKHTGFGVFAPVVTTPTGTAYGSSSLSTADVDGDQVPDVAVTQLMNPTAQLLLFKGAATGLFTSAGVAPLQTAAGQTKFMDLNGDAAPDLVAYTKIGSSTGGSKIQTLVGTGSFQFTATGEQLVPSVAGPSPAELADVDRDGRADFVFGCEHPQQICVFRALGDGTLAPPRNFTWPGAVTSISCADVDGDGRVDLLAASKNGVKLALALGEIESGTSGYGVGCAGSGGSVPALSIQGGPTSGASLSLRVEHGLGGSIALLLFGASTASIPMSGSGCTLLVSPLFPAILALPLGGTGSGNGSIQFDAIVPPGTPDASIALQVLVADPGVAPGFSATTAVTVAIKN